jgi:hypothetical protein
LKFTHSLLAAALALAPILSCKLFSFCLVVYGKIDTYGRANCTPRRPSFAVAACCTQLTKKKPTKEFAIDPTTSLPLLSFVI